MSVVGTGMRTHTGVAEQMFAALARGGRQHEDDHHRRHQDLRAGGPGRRRAGPAGGPPGVRPARRPRPGAGEATGPDGGRRPARAVVAGDAEARPGVGRSPGWPAWKTSSSARCSWTPTRPHHHLRPAGPAGQLLGASSRPWPPGGIVVDMIVQNLTGAGPGRAVVQRAAGRPGRGRSSGPRTRSRRSTRRPAWPADADIAGAVRATASACGRTRAWPGRCSGPWPSAASTSP